jgi:uncharacterized integral membrane protein
VKISTLLLAVPVIVVAGVIAVANREEVTFSLDPFALETPSLSFSVPLFLLVFLSFFAGVLLGGLVAALRRSKLSNGSQARAVALRE